MGVPTVPQYVDDGNLPDGYISNAMSAGPCQSFDLLPEWMWCIIALLAAASIGVQVHVVRLPAYWEGWCPERCGVCMG